MAIIYNKTEKKMKDSYGELLSFMISLWSFLSRLLYNVHQLYINEPLYIIMKSAV